MKSQKLKFVKKGLAIKHVPEDEARNLVEREDYQYVSKFEIKKLKAYDRKMNML